FTERESVELLTQIAQKMQPHDYFLLGLDRIKDKRTLEKAYDDREGVTAKFNLNVLSTLNKNLAANFKLDQFFHQAIYNEKDEQIEMYLVSKQAQVIEIFALDEAIQLKKREKILTEISRKYNKSSIRRMLAKSGLDEQLHFEPENEYFSLVLAKLKV
ncbi:MAG: L-histidine N(alpha)-methyltransferase, partial [Gammaproteobacteria bacterium]|nr:L-histidine N(alpha)-methyltransferase [Gammaproteobacteria bacterium]